MKNQILAPLLPSLFFRRRQLSLRIFLRICCATLLLSSLNALAAITYPPIDSFLWGNTAVNAVGQTSRVSGNGWGYRYLTPKNYDSSKKYPLIIFLHGSGEGTNSHNDNAAQLTAGGNTGNGALALVSLENQQNYPVFFVAPQNSSGFWNSGGPYLQAIINTLKTVYPNAIDEDRICLTGLSAGGFGTWDIPATTMPGVFSCLVSLSGGSGTISKLQADMPIWSFHSADDVVVGVSDTEAAVNAWRNYGRKIIFTRYDTSGHSLTSWKTAYETPQLLPWMLAQRRGQPMAGIVDLKLKSVAQGSALNLTVTTPPALTVNQVGWSSNLTTSAQTGSDGVINGSSYSSASANFLNKPAANGRIGISYSRTANNKVYNWKRYYDVASISSATTLLLSQTPATNYATGAYTVYRQGKEENPMPGSHLGAEWTLNDIPLSAGFNLIHAIAELPTSGSLGGKTTVNQPYWIGYSAVTGDTTAPAVAIINPAGASITTAGVLNLSGTASDAGGVTQLRWHSDRGYGGTLTPNSNWAINNVPLVLGNNQITVTALDAKGNLGSAVLLDVIYTGVPANRTPMVDAGAYQAISLPANSVTLAGSASDDGLPTATLSKLWSKVSGPGSVSFSNAAALNGTATFSMAGSYVLRLTAADSHLSASSDITFTVRPNSSVVAAIDAGSSSAYTAADGSVYAADTIGTGSISTSTASTNFAGTNDQPIYRSARYSNSGNVTYAIPLANGSYDVVLQFAETINVPQIDGMRVFDVAAEGQTIITHLDILAQAGRLTAYERVIRVTVSDGVLNLSFNKVVGSPTISGIVVRQAVGVPVVDPPEPNPNPKPVNLSWMWLLD
ncbi:MAG: malectin domain-containing carbohydrate-binding protein [Pseudomonadota bacterium]